MIKPKDDKYQVRHTLYKIKMATEIKLTCRKSALLSECASWRQRNEISHNSEVFHRYPWPEMRSKLKRSRQQRKSTQGQRIWDCEKR